MCVDKIVGHVIEGSVQNWSRNVRNFIFFRILSTVYYLMVIGYSGRSVNLNTYVTILVQM